MRRSGSTCLFALIAVIVFALGFTPLGGAAAAGKQCGTVNAHWSLAGHHGTQFTVQSIGGASCSFALLWAPKLIKEKPIGHPAELLVGPPGWICATSGVGDHAGSCDKSHHIFTNFSWTEKL